MAEDGKTSGVSVDIAAKATFEVKAEIPKESTGRALDALIDIIRPFTEARGLKADVLRLQRAEVAYEIAKIAKRTAEVEAIDLKPPPTKFLVPFLEQASLEDQDTELHTRWAALLLSASTNYEARHLTFIDLLSRMSSQELALLEEVCVGDPLFPLTMYPDGHIEQNQRAAEKGSFFFNIGDSSKEKNRQLFPEFLSATKLTYSRVMHVTIGGLADMQDLYTDFGGPLSQKYPSLEILERERLVEFRRVRASGAAAEVAYFSVTNLGVDFIRDCSPSGREGVRKEKAKARPARS
jgi:Abortive infection alpha